MSQHEIIVALVNKTNQARKNWFATRSKREAKEWDEWSIALEKIVLILNENEQNKKPS